MKKSKPGVWVPFECFLDGTEKKCNDLPRFTSVRELRDYLRDHNQRLRARRLQWREHFEKEYLEEYRAGVGRLSILLKG